ncbi:unnamed protein product [Prorocentrum cordatum]|uniref:EF-hand domain-containing protein n=1 Tax=Prorocentrum cordatum TaxID=2364126 RepID=A0ABN9RE67_9DINO|nr:unnamed protein product [Polarella glacialis]
MAGDFQSAVWIKQDMFNMLVVWSVLLVAVAAGPIRSRLREFAALKRGAAGARAADAAPAQRPAAAGARAAARARSQPARPARALPAPAAPSAAPTARAAAAAAPTARAAAPAQRRRGSAGPAGGRGAPGALGGLVPCPFAACGWRGPAAAYAGHVAACGLRRNPCGGAAGLHEPDELPAAPRPVPQGAAGAAEAAAPAGGPRGGRRAEAARRAFRALDVDCKGYLTSDELKTFAGMSGFDGTDADWQVEFGTLCRQWRRSPAEGIDQPFFCAIVDDASERGVYCTDEELAGIHQRLVADRLVRGARAPGDRADAAAAEVRVARLLFQLLDLDGDGRLCAEELRPLAILTGFEGDDEEWAAEYALLCQERRCEAGRGLPLTAYLDMVGDRSGGGCFCSAALLRLFAEELAHGLAARGGVAAAAAPRA